MNEIDGKSLYDAAVALGVQIDNHESDLYLPVTPETEKLIDGYVHKQNVTRFQSERDGKMWFDIPFAYIPFWEAKRRS